MNVSRFRLLMLALSVISLGIIFGTLVWLKLPARTGFGEWNGTIEGLGEYGTVPDFSLLERTGRRVSLKDLRGKVWIADFIYTTCKDTCPMQSAEMSKLQDAWSDRSQLQFVSFSVDPEHDTPEVLTEYARNFRADGNRWLFLTGDKAQISGLVQDGFRLSAAPVTESGSEDSVILHSPRFVLIDKAAQIRGYYDSREQDALARLKKDVLTLISAKE
jgi:protein SCO1/2